MKHWQGMVWISQAVMLLLIISVPLVFLVLALIEMFK